MKNYFKFLFLISIFNLNLGRLLSNQESNTETKELSSSINKEEDSKLSLKSKLNSAMKKTVSNVKEIAIWCKKNPKATAIITTLISVIVIELIYIIKYQKIGSEINYRQKKVDRAHLETIEKSAKHSEAIVQTLEYNNILHEMQKVVNELRDQQSLKRKEDFIKKHLENLKK